MDINILNSFLFHPRKAFQQMGENDHLIEVEKGINVGARFHLNNPAAPTILFFHGNGEIAPEYDDIAPLYNQKGFNFIIEMVLPMQKIPNQMLIWFWIIYYHIYKKIAIQGLCVLWEDH